MEPIASWSEDRVSRWLQGEQHVLCPLRYVGSRRFEAKIDANPIGSEKWRRNEEVLVLTEQFLICVNIWIKLFDFYLHILVHPPEK